MIFFSMKESLEKVAIFHICLGQTSLTTLRSIEKNLPSGI